MMSANNWSDKVAFDNFGLALKGEANTWLDSQVMLKKIVGDRERWTIVRPFFKEEFAQSQTTNSSWTVWPIWQCGQAKMSGAFSGV
jgi:hypothetical protein